MANDWKNDFTEFRPGTDWPLCPECGADELWSDYATRMPLGPEPGRAGYTTYAHIALCRVRCVACGYDRPAPPSNRPTVAANNLADRWERETGTPWPIPR